jgi:hypothetical protein
MKAKFAIAVSLGLVTMLTFGCRQTENASLEKQKSLILAKTMGDALAAKTLLTEIREGRITNAVETLEFAIDCSILEMGHATNCDAVTQQQALQTLRLLNEYRQKYPRKIEAVIGEGDELKQNRKITEEANEFLEKVGHPAERTTAIHSAAQ